MVWRTFTFFLCQFLAAVAGWFLGPTQNHWADSFMLGMAGGFLWFTLDSLRGIRLLNWLRNDAVSDMKLGNGLWGEAYDRIRRSLRARDRMTQESDARLTAFLAALQASPSGVVLLDAEGRIEWFNAMACMHFGFDAKRDTLQHFGNLVRDPGFAAYHAAGNYLGDVKMPGRQSSSSKPVQLSVQMHPYGEGRNLLLSRDITALQQAEAMRRDFVANVSHEIRTPLTVLAGFIETMQSLPLSAQDQHRYLAMMEQQASRMQTLVSDLLTLSRLEGSPLPSAQEWVSLDGLMQQCATDARGLSSVLNEQQHDFRFESISGIELSGSGPELYSALSNLIGNAIRYSPPDKKIDVRCVRGLDSSLVMSVHDNGPGIAPEHIPRLTERFYRVDRSRSRETGGTGLGLAIVKHVAQRHGAELLIESVPGQGSTFSLVFPASRTREVAFA